jgi:hypothetical protein
MTLGTNHYSNKKYKTMAVDYTLTKTILFYNLPGLLACTVLPDVTCTAAHIKSNTGLRRVETTHATIITITTHCHDTNPTKHTTKPQHKA